MKQITPCIYEWSQYLRDEQIDRNGYFVQSAPGQPGAAIDPVPPQPGDREQIAALGGVAAVLLTGSTTVAARDLDWWRQGFGCAIWAPGGEVGAAAGAGAGGDNSRLLDVKPLPIGETLPGGLVANSVPAGTSPGAAAFYHPASGSWFAGDVVVGVPAGDLSLPPDVLKAGPEQAAAAARGLRALLSAQVRRLLVARGTPVLRDAVGALQDLLFRHDPAAFLLRPEELVWAPPRAKGSRFSRRSAECSRLLGLKTLDFEITTVPPGKQSTLMHGHPGYEELFVVLDGEGAVQTEGGTFPIRAGDMLGFPARNHVAHGIRNSGERELRFLSFGAHAHPEESPGVAEYPESRKQLQWLGPGRARIFYVPENVHVDYWEGERLDEDE